MCERHGADDAFPIGDIDDILPGLIENKSRVYYAMGHFQEFDQRMLAWIARARGGARSSGGPGELVMLDHLVHEMRLFKSKAEIDVMSKAAQVSAAAHERAMRVCRPGMAEYQIEAELLYEFTRAGCRAAAYPSIVARGANSCTLHYTSNSDRLRDRDLLLIDAGRRVRALRLRHYPHVPCQRQVLPRAARRVLGGARGAGSRHRHGGARPDRR